MAEMLIRKHSLQFVFMKKLILSLLLGATALLFSACARTQFAGYEPCHAEGMVAGSINVRSQKLLSSEISLGEIGGGQRTNPRIASNVGNAGFSKALRISLAQSGLYDDGGALMLDAMLVDEKVTQGFKNASFSVEEQVRYTLRERESGKTLFRVKVTSYGRASSKIHIKDRLRAAKERAIKMNIENFLVALDRKFLSDKAKK